MKIACVWEHNGNDTQLFAETLPGAFARGASKEAALAKMSAEIRSYLLWAGEAVPEEIQVQIVQEWETKAPVCDADSDVIFDAERAPLTEETYIRLKRLALRSAECFYFLYQFVPDKNASCLPERKTFYGFVPRTAEEMYRHTKNCNAYYFGEVGVDAGNEGTIVECRKKGFALLEKDWVFLENPVRTGSYGELWSVRKMLRRFLWHDRIHAKAMYKMAVRTFPGAKIENPFFFDVK